jgi:hypothetical protein
LIHILIFFLKFQSRVSGVSAFGKELIDGGHYASEEIVTRKAELESQWDVLRARSADKTQKLLEASAQQQFNNAVHVSYDVIF